MKLGVILQSNEAEKAWNGVRFCNAALKQGHEVQLFLMSAGVEAATIAHPTYNVEEQLRAFVAGKGVVHACGTCLTSRNQEASAVCPVSTMFDCLAMVEWADKVVTF